MNQEYFFSKKQRILFIVLVVGGVMISLLLGAYAEPSIQLNTIEKSYGQMLVIRGNGFTLDSEYTIKLITPNNLEINLAKGLTKGEIGLTHPIEFDAIKGTYEIIIETEFETASAEFTFDKEITAEYKEYVESNTPYGGNVAPEINKAENVTQAAVINSSIQTNSTEHYFAELGENGTIKRIIVAEQNVIDSGAFGDPKNWIEYFYPTSEPIIEKPLVKEIPSWVKEVFKMWANGQITDNELLNGIRYLVNIGVIVVS